MLQTLEGTVWKLEVGIKIFKRKIVKIWIKGEPTGKC